MATPVSKQARSFAPTEANAANRSQSALTGSEAPDAARAAAVYHAPTGSTHHITNAQRAAAERQIAIESLRSPAAHHAMTASQHAELQPRASTKPPFAAAALYEVAFENTHEKYEERRKVFVDQLATMLVTRNIRTTQLQQVHFKRATLPEFRHLLDAAVAAKERDPAVLAEREAVMAWRLDVERQKHEYVWAVWHAENVERAARREAVMRAEALELASASTGPGQ